MLSKPVWAIANRVSSGLTPLRSNPEFWLNGTIPWLKTEQLGEKLIYSTTEKISEVALRKTSIKVYPPNTLSIAMYGEGKTRGNVSIIKSKMATNQACCNIELDPELADFEYVYYFLKTQYNELRNLSSGVRKNLNSDDIKNFVIRLPKNLTEQKKIVGALSALDAKIDCNKRINFELEAMAKALFDYWFVQFDFPDSDGKPYKSSGGKMVYNTLLKRDIPQNWAATPLSSITPVSNESLNPADFPDRLFKHFSIPVFDVVKTYGVEPGQSIGSNKFTVLGADLLVSKLNPWSNRVVYAMDEADQICSTEFVVWRSSSENLKNFLFLIATSQQFISHCVQSASGTSNSHKRVNPSVMMRFELPYEEKVAAEFGKVINPILKKLIVNQRENQYLSQLRDWLLPMLMNGQVMVV
ncbi:restriction endonuclease subunit S [Pseudomonas syringae group sp. 243L2]|uniref:restriction endonuclease subunit S n=1 Tax=Pseudomonas syringae group sp. 243L2 TaxID=3079593 RepID=UPI00291182AD|nr:restriction endonuclease subunit S [Pseudomonas syringae group sp. 243L2]MDU8629874.1 restriction endonuclease subunit S [Pseudomonas syringae group sp. 243L2]